MRHHWFWDRTERLFSRAERLADEWQFEEALRYFDEAIQTDQQYAHLYLYKAMALAELGRFQEASESFGMAERLAPDNVVFPMFHAAALLDQGNPGAALQSLERALKLDAQNEAMRDYSLLARWDLGEHAAFWQLRRNLRGIPAHLGSRIAVRIEERRIDPDPNFKQAGNHRDRRFFPEWLHSRFDRIRGALARRRLARVDRLLAAHRYDTALQVLDSFSVATFEAEKEYDAKRAAALAGMCRKERERLKTLAGIQRQKVLLRLGLLQAEAGQNDEAYKNLDNWVKEFGSPGNNHPSSATALTQMAEIDLARQHYTSAVRHCHEARALGVHLDPRIDLIEAKAALSQRNRRDARRLFERYLHKDAFYLDRRIEQNESNH
jgi:tetratricopeptide (TPR) repeat protein